ncbi:DUF3421 domain-containing protein [Legionella waltersii]|uniref:Uncharacterized protein n=1 Tax=Legionella waltersii TaxID=66969 RepID=A0A0W1ADJ3_9GAMM|nr:DUF3421 domain-containing protein [Legionella waltersii]KTD79394.1 hypothetical protein Lwal_1466 [Legionella waltersii]SNU97901.1 Protein of uncharacterised function (DUF3421) [Legionella waltersii]
MFRIALSFILILLFSPLFATTHYHQSSSPFLYALRTGTDTNGRPLYLCRAKLFNSIQPGKTWPGYGRCNVPYGGKEYIVSEFTLPTQQEIGHINWEPANAQPLVIGRDTNGNPLFVCQANFNGSIQPGKTWPGYYHCNISYGGREVITDNYRVLSAQSEIIVRSPTTGRRNSGNTHYHD